MLNYLGQGALMLEHPPAHDGELFYSMAPREFRYPMVALATVATVIASQGLISGSFSLASQAVALGLFPRLHNHPYPPRPQGANLRGTVQPQRTNHVRTWAAGSKGSCKSRATAG
jgi:hypothetical protein